MSVGDGDVHGDGALTLGRGVSPRAHLASYVRKTVQALFHQERPHQGKGNVILFPAPGKIPSKGPVACRERLGGLLKYYHREAG